MTSVIVIAVAVILVAGVFFVGKNRRKTIHYSDAEPEPTNTAVSLRLQEINLMIEYQMKTKKVYLDPKLRVTKLAELVGTNRTYLVNTLHHFHGTGYSNYVNHFRFEELKLVMLSGKQYTSEEYCHLTGFPTVETMMRSVKLYSGMLFKDFMSTIESKYLIKAAQLEVAEDSENFVDRPYIRESEDSV